MAMKSFLRRTVQRLRIVLRTKKAILICTIACCSVTLPTFFAIAQAPADNRNPVNVAPTAASSQQDSQRTIAIILVKNALLAVNQGNLTGNYTVLRDLASPGFREKNSAADLAAIFQNIRQQ